jgi:hypothetical protein
VVSIFREHTVRRCLNPPSLPHCLTVNSGAVSFDAYDPLAVEGAPCTLAFSSCNSEITAADNARSIESVASAFNLLGVTRVKLKLAKAAVSLAELYGNNGRASVKDKALDDFGFGLRLKNGCHGEKKREALASLQEQ